MIVVFVLLMSMGARANEASWLQMSAYSEAKEGPLKLRHIATFSDDLKSSGVLDVELGIAPKPGDSLRLTHLMVSQAIQHYISGLGHNAREERQRLLTARLTIPKEIVVQGAGWKSSVKFASAMLKKNLEQLCGVKCEAEIDNLILPQYKPTYTEQAQLQPPVFREVPKGTFSIETAVMLSGQVLERVWIQGRVRMLKEVPVATRLLVQGTRLLPSDFEVKKMDVTMANDTCPEINKLVGVKLGRPLAANQIILNSHIEREQDVLFGQNVQAIIRSNAWQVTIQAIARDNGSVGDRIKIFNPQSKKMLTGVLISKGVVEIQ